MKKMLDFDTIECSIDDDDALYDWAKDYTFQHKCTVKKFIRDNYEEIIEHLQRKQQKTCKPSKNPGAFEKTSKLLAEKCRELGDENVISPKAVGFALMAAGQPAKAVKGRSKDQEVARVCLENDKEGNVLVPKKILDGEGKYIAEKDGKAIVLKKALLDEEGDAGFPVKAAGKSFVKIPLGGRLKNRALTAHKYLNGDIVIL